MLKGDAEAPEEMTEMVVAVNLVRVAVNAVGDAVDEAAVAVTSAVVVAISLVAVVIPIGAIAVGYLLGPRRPDAIKNETYESGVETIGDTWVQFKAQYYLIGLVFLIFDVEVIFLFPIAVAYKAMSFFGVMATISFVVILLLGLLLEWRKGALEWE